MRPNVLLVTLDQFRADCLGVAGHPLVQTPTLDRLAADGVRFSHHFSNCTPCGPARASLLTGLWQMNHRVTDNGAPLADHLPTLPRQLRELGYRPALFGYTDTTLDPAGLLPDARELTEWEQPMRGFDPIVHLDDYIGPWLSWLAEEGFPVPDPKDYFDIYDRLDVEVPPGRGESWAPPAYDAEHTESAFLTGEVLAWLERTLDTDGGASDGRPWCAHVSYLRPHPPYVVPGPYNDMFDPAEVPAPVRHADVASEGAVHPFLAAALAIVPSPSDRLNQDQLRATYYGMIAEVDHQLGRLLDGLDELGQRDDTLVVVTSDHGEQLGDHWLIEKLGFFDQSVRIPLIIRWPAMDGSPGRTIDAFTENVDILPTILDVCDAEAPTFCDGASLRPFLDSERVGLDTPGRWRRWVHTEYDFRMPTTTVVEDLLGIRQDQCAVSVIRDRSRKYVQFSGGLAPLFFDLDEDPGELRDLASDPARSVEMLRYVQQLLSTRMEHTDPRLANHRATPMGPVFRADPPRP
ncbi:MAG: alkaline phosphatase family protein [Actinobacteria bacterium]|nr:alkaline phosphatase family protein [Actinomycetota bacterium]